MSIRLAFPSLPKLNPLACFPPRLTKTEATHTRKRTICEDETQSCRCSVGGGALVGGCWLGGRIGLPVAAGVRCWLSTALCWSLSISELGGERGLLSGSFTSSAFAPSWDSICSQEHTHVCAAPLAAWAPSSVRFGILKAPLRCSPAYRCWR